MAVEDKERECCARRTGDDLITLHVCHNELSRATTTTPGRLTPIPHPLRGARSAEERSKTALSHEGDLMNTLNADGGQEKTNISYIITTRIEGVCVLLMPKQKSI